MPRTECFHRTRLRLAAATFTVMLEAQICAPGALFRTSCRREVSGNFSPLLVGPLAVRRIIAVSAVKRSAGAESPTWRLCSPLRHRSDGS
jgi:hypothetical protein